MKQNISQNFTNVKLRVGKEVELALGGVVNETNLFSYQT